MSAHAANPAVGRMRVMPWLCLSKIAKPVSKMPATTIRNHAMTPPSPRAVLLAFQATWLTLEPAERRLEAAQPQAVTDDEYRAERHRGGGDHRVQQAERGQRD